MPFSSVKFGILADEGIHEEVVFGQGPSASVKFQVAWADRYNFINNCCGKSTGGRGAIVRTAPFAYPPSPNLVAIDGTIAPLGKMRADGTGWANYDNAIVTIHFGILPFSFGSSDASDDPSGVPWTTTSFEMAAEFISAPDSVYKFAGGIPTGAPVGMILPQCTITFKRHWIPFLPVLEMLSLLATPLNNAPFVLGDFIFPTETLMFMGGPSDRETDTLGDSVQTVEYKMMYRPVSWNKFLHPNGTSGWQYIYDGSGNKVYQLGDFTTLP